MLEKKNKEMKKLDRLAIYFSFTTCLSERDNYLNVFPNLTVYVKYIVIVFFKLEFVVHWEVSEF